MSLATSHPVRPFSFSGFGISILSLIIVGLASSFSQPTIAYRAKLEGKWCVFTTNNNDDDDDNNSYNYTWIFENRVSKKNNSIYYLANLKQ